MGDQDRIKPVSAQVHAQLLRMICDSAVSPVEAADRCGITLVELARWSMLPLTRADIQGLRDVADLSTQILLSRHRVGALARLMEVAHETEGETARRASKDLLTINVTPRHEQPDAGGNDPNPYGPISDEELERFIAALPKEMGKFEPVPREYRLGSLLAHAPGPGRAVALLLLLLILIPQLLSPNAQASSLKPQASSLLHKKTCGSSGRRVGCPVE